ncbi:GNAT family N-acetyltransferase [Aeromicrobium ginsengisoli]|uniref:GNAT family N-acetyltransferase n=1 Tax=Aeromicrobium ginsengisoli TaxID=363867 RepID=A0A5M4FD90_9ACTN|nr:GNAT family N-acetyltransferase [Aeromicrobium ginsengisoli]KAA1395862.1 GNAT family N-acetyltransferase [Aeromicrobium ginsengisoli]
MNTISFTIEEIQVPETIEGAGWEVFEEYVTVRDAVESHTMGTDLLELPLADVWSEYRDNPHRTRRHFAVWQDGGIIGRGIVTLRPHQPEIGSHLMADILPEHRRQGIGNALFEVVERVAIEAGAPVLKVVLPHTTTAGGERVAPPTGFGDLSADDDGVRFLISHGYALEQISRISLLETAGLAERLDPLREASAKAAGDDYRVVTWTGLTPERWTRDLAELRTRMSTDAPSAGLVMTVDEWDVERVREHDARIAESGRTILTSAAEHVASGSLVAFSELVLSDGKPLATQEDTLVLRDHRGHRLGMLVKIAAADLLLEQAPEREAIVTWNAEENRPMLDVNEALGFRAIGYEGGWQKRV